MEGKKITKTFVFNQSHGFIISFPKWFILFLCSINLTACQIYNSGMLNPQGIIAYEERKLFFDTLALMLIVVLPVIIMSITFVYHYRASHKLKDYQPNWSHSYFLESIWWGIPCLIIAVLAFLTWKATYQLDPYQPIKKDVKPSLLVQAIALPWKWLFIYPQYNIATVNYLKIPVEQEVEFWITADNVPMSAFFIPQLGSQIYAMAGMRSRLYLLANQTGETLGLNALFNGEGFAGMHFPVYIVTLEEMQAWVDQVKKSTFKLDQKNYTQLLVPSIDNQAQIFSGVANDLFQVVINTYLQSSGPIHPRQKE